MCIAEIHDKIVISFPNFPDFCFCGASEMSRLSFLNNGVL